MKYLLFSIGIFLTGCSNSHPAVEAAWQEYTAPRNILIVPEDHLMDDWNDNERNTTVVVISDNPVNIPEDWEQEYLWQEQ